MKNYAVAATITLILLTAFLYRPSAKAQQVVPAGQRWEYATFEIDLNPATPMLLWSDARGLQTFNDWDRAGDLLGANPKSEKDNPLIRVLNALGKQGWELVAKETTFKATYKLESYVLKRPAR